MLKANFKSIAELIVMFLFLPVVLWQAGLMRELIGILWISFFLCYLFIRKTYQYNFKQDWNIKAVKLENIGPIAVRFFFSCLFMIAITAIFEQEKLFAFPAERPLLWLAVMFLYPVFSVIPQEIIYRSFFMRRYEKIFNQEALIVTNSVAFGVAHILLGNWVAVLLSIIGGYFFATTYVKHKSLSLVCLEHAAYGCALFTIGLGWYFYHGR